MPLEKVKIDKELQDSLRDIVKLCEQEDKDIRNLMTRQWRKNEEFWHGVQFLFWSAKDDSWKSPLDFGWDESDDQEIESQLGSFSDKVVDIFRAHGESIIAALSSQIPGVRFLPDDADDPNDLMTSRTYSRIADLIQRHNKAKMIFFRALFFLGVQGMVASYRYKDSDMKYGSYKVPVYGTQKISTEKFVCKTCGYESLESWSNELGTVCPQCGSNEEPKQEEESQDVPVQTGEEQHPKSRAKIDVFGPLHFKVPYYARNQDECSYFILYCDQGKDVVQFTYPDNAEEIEQEYLETTDRFARSIYGIGEPETEQRFLVLVKKCWLRPAAFYRETTKHKRDRLLKKFPNGCRVTFVGEKGLFIDVYNQSLDDCWKIGQAGISTFIHSDPFLRPLVMIQEMRNDLVNLILETIKHGIPSEFADSEVVNFDIYGKFEAVPGYIYKAKPRRPGEPLGNAFYTSNRSQLSREAALFLKQLDQDAQFCVGSFPSVYGGPSEGKSRTFAEYRMSRSVALQRLSILWNFVKEWWVETIRGCVEIYKECVIEDEKYTKFVNGNYVNVWIKRSEMAGKIGGVEPEGDESFPTSWAQMQELLLKLMELNNEYINTVLYNPTNARMMKLIFSLTELKVPGEDQRIKQSLETSQLLQSPPIDPEQSSIPIDIDVDDHAVHIAEIREFCVDPSLGLEEKRVNPQGYANLIAHLHEHQNAILMMQSALPAPVPTNTGAMEE